MNRFMAENPHSPLISQIRYAHALNLFDAGDYAAAAKEFAAVKVKRLYRGQRAEYTFRKAYCALENSRNQEALEGFKEVEKLPMCDYTAPSRYAIGYIYYDMKDFREALGWFEKSLKDARFADLSAHYIMECRFMLGDHKYVTENGDRMYEQSPDERRPKLARMISESWLVLGDAGQARKYMELNAISGGQPAGSGHHRGI
jgi:tetratricopeptide (TPR) repeat protein